MLLTVAALTAPILIGPVPCGTCDGEGEVCRNFGVDSEERPAIVPCPTCEGTGLVLL